MEKGVDVREYYLWTFLDNWEWTGGKPNALRHSAL